MKTILVMLAAAVAFLAPTSASAATFVATYEGVLETTGTDSIFGQLNAGQRYVARYSFNISTAGANFARSGTDSSGSEQYLGVGSANPITSAILTINGISYEFSGDGFGYARTENDFFGRDRVLHSQQNPNGGEFFTSEFASFDTGLLGTRDVTQTLTLTGTSEWQSVFRTNAGQNFFMRADFFGLTNSAVPEPATWAMMLLGFFGIGGMMRLRNQSQRALLA